MAEIALVSDLICPDYPERTGECAQAASIAFLLLKDRHPSIFMQGSHEADRGAASLLALMTTDGNGCQVLHVVHIDVSSTTMLHLAGRLTAAAANASADININRHLISPGYPAG
jgi:hypothetical protein